MDGLVARPRRAPKDLTRIDPARRVSHWRAPAWSGGLVRCATSACAAFPADRLAIEETELLQSNREELLALPAASIVARRASLGHKPFLRLPRMPRTSARPTDEPTDRTTDFIAASATVCRLDGRGAAG